MDLRRRSAFTALLALLGCAPKPVPARALTYPVLALEGYGPAVYADEAAFCTTTENGQDRYRLMVVMDAKGVRYTVTEAVVESRSSPWILDLAGNAPIRMSLTLKPEKAMSLEEAKLLIAAHVRAKGDYLDQIDGGRPRALLALESDGSFQAVLDRFAGPYAFKAVLARTQGEADRRAGVAPGPHPRSEPRR